jgi:hypothetical protein
MSIVFDISRSKGLEIWKPVKGWENSHEVSSVGRVRSIARKGSKQKVLSQRLVEGYPSVTLCADCARKSMYVHHLVALAFVGCPPGEIGSKRGQYTVNHKDFNKTNNSFENLEWLTCGENYIHAFSNGRVEVKRGGNATNRKLSPSDVKQIKKLLSQGVKPSELAKQFSVVRGTIYAIKSGLSWAEG